MYEKNIQQAKHVAATFRLRKNKIREKKHRLPLEYYTGQIACAFTICVKNKRVLFNNPRIINIFIELLKKASYRYNCIVPVYCFMPDHLHIILIGKEENSNLWKAISYFKQITGYWLAKNKLGKWQKDFYDHIIRKHEDLVAQVKYVLDNPVRKGLVDNWQDYPYKGSIGINLEDVLAGVLR